MFVEQKWCFFFVLCFFIFSCSLRYRRFSQEIGKVCFHAHFPRDYPRTPPTMLLTDELVHPNWKFPARGLQVPDLTKDGWDPTMTIPKVRCWSCCCACKYFTVCTCKYR